MQLFLSDGSPPARSRGATGLIAGALLIVLLGLGLAGSVAPASADASPGNTSRADVSPGDTNPPTDTPPPPAQPPAIDDPGTSLVTRLPFTVTGMGTAGDQLQISGAAGGSADSRCTVTVADDGRWSCSLAALPDGPSVVIRATSAATGLADTVSVAVLAPPTIDAPSGALVSGGGVHGTAYPGATVTVRASNGATCRFPADSSGLWGCVLGGLKSGHYTVTATQRAPFSGQSSAASPQVPITIDTTAPGRPTIESPRAGLSAQTGQAVTFSGAGERHARITVYGSDDAGSVVICRATVTAAGAWSCRGTLPSGSFIVSALQRDAAGNVSPGSNSVTLKFTSSAPAPNRTPTSPGSPSHSPSTTPAPAVPGVPPQLVPSPTPPAVPHQPGMPDWMGTAFTTASAPVVTFEAFPGWLRSIVLAIAALILLALPARLLAGTIARNRSGEVATAHAGLFGRNRSRAELREADALLGSPAIAPDSGAAVSDAVSLGGAAGAAGAAAAVGAEDGTAAAAPARSPWPIVGAFAVAAALVTLSSPVDDAAAYLRVVLAIAIALVAVNGLWVGIARWAAPHLAGAHTRVVFQPYQLLIVGAAAIVSRMFGLQPALLFGLILGVALVEGTGRAARGRLAAVQLAGLAAAGVLAWLTVGILPTPTGIVSAFLLELVNAVALLALGSAAVALIPVGILAGRAVLQWSRLMWLGLSLVVYTLLFALLLPVASLVESGGNWPVVMLVALGFAALSLCVWLWDRFVEPSRQ
ncbi:hypothetical protein [Leifsonia sp. NPDC058248]|uniref:hypothetical protein n=1 Tax=Leifsonia sp. NPDC058248 TaxID=3346402 RepID=UPI0036D78183